MPIKYSVIPAQAGIHGAASQLTDRWIPDQVRDDSIYFSAMSAHPFPPSSPPYAGTQGRKETAGLLPRMPGQAGHDGERGNALFLILIAVALFAALSYAITQSSRGGGGTDRENLSIAAAQIDQAIAAYRTSVQRMVLVYGVPVTQLDDSLPPTHTTQTNPSCTSNTCRIFHPEGGGVTPFVLTGDANLAGPLPYATMRFALGPMGKGTTVYGTGLLDIMVALKVSEELCIYYNKIHGYTGTVPSSTIDPSHLYFASSVFALSTLTVGFWGALNSGEAVGCQYNGNGSAFNFEEDPATGYYIIGLIHPR